MRRTREAKMDRAAIGLCRVFRRHHFKPETRRALFMRDPRSVHAGRYTTHTYLAHVSSFGTAGAAAGKYQDFFSGSMFFTGSAHGMKLYTSAFSWSDCGATMFETSFHCVVARYGFKGSKPR